MKFIVENDVISIRLAPYCIHDVHSVQIKEQYTHLFSYLQTFLTKEITLFEGHI